MTTYFTFLVAIIVVIAADQAIKTLIIYRARTRFQFLGSTVIRVVLNRNSRRQINSPSLLVGLWVIEVMILSLLARCEPWSHSQWAQTAFGIVVGGVTANLTDQLWRDGIVDFIDLRIWPVFNIADLAIVVGASGVVMSAV